MTLDDVVLDENILKIFQEYKRKGDIGNLLFIGNAGIGKTSLAKIVAKDILKCQYEYINASDENGIDTIRTKVSRFAELKSFDGNVKILILDESDGLSKSGQDALRNLMESRLDNVRFILTANYGHKISEPIKSRCQSFDIKYSKKDYVKRIFHILNSEEIEYDQKQVINVCVSHFPDFRSCINDLQKSVIDKKLEYSTTSISGFVGELFDVFSTNIENIRQFYLNNENRFNNDYEYLLNGMYDYICNKSLDQMVKMEAILIVAETLKDHVIVTNPEINFYSAIIKLKKIV